MIYNGLQLTKGQNIAIIATDGKPVMTYTLPRSMNGCLFISSGSLTNGSTYQVCSGGSLSAATDSWNGWCEGGSWSDGSTVGSFTVNGTVTTVGTSSGPGGGGGFPGGNRPR